MTPNKHPRQRHWNGISTVRTKRNAESRAKASKIDHQGIAVMLADAQRRHSGTFSLLLEGNALAPDFRDGDLLTISPNISPHPGDAVVMRIDGRYGCMRINADGDLWDAFGGFVPVGAYTIEGVVIEHGGRG